MQKSRNLGFNVGVSRNWCETKSDGDKKEKKCNKRLNERKQIDIKEVQEKYKHGNREKEKKMENKKVDKVVFLFRFLFYARVFKSLKSSPSFAFSSFKLYFTLFVLKFSFAFVWFQSLLLPFSQVQVSKEVTRFQKGLNITSLNMQTKDKSVSSGLNFFI